MYTLCDGKDPSSLKFDQSEMRSHYAACIENEKFDSFPSEEMFRHKKIDTVYDTKTRKIDTKNKSFC